MKYLLLACLFIVPGLSLNAQETKKTTRDLLLDTLCQCITKKAEATPDADPKDIVTECFVSDGMSLLAKYAEEKEVEMTDEDAMEKLGKDLGIDLTMKCPAMMKLAMKTVKEEQKTKPRKPSTVQTEELSGIISSVNSKDFPASFQLKETNGNSRKIYIVTEFFTSDDRFYNPSYMPGKIVTIQYKKEKVFIPSQKKFEELDVLYKLTDE